ncbi:hypothetical protein E2C01_038081 [Portunus trituberculatus]|uniref:Uncharacterized protein n=1 Tax=Portunus trituberculatus TaxID=210409 RepID=A0A5B7FHK1_PORTR|nr:hypothetical protein [Portunus trituberculatus]
MAVRVRLGPTDNRPRPLPFLLPLTSRPNQSFQLHRQPPIRYTRSYPNPNFIHWLVPFTNPPPFPPPRIPSVCEDPFSQAITGCGFRFS